MRSSLFFSMLWFISLNIFSHEYSDLFSLMGKDISSQKVNHKEITEDTSFSIDTLGQVSGFAISADIEFDNETESHVRVIVQDREGKEYLVYEDFPLMTGQKSFAVDKIAYESSLLDNVMLSKMTVYLHNARLRLKSIHYKGPSIIHEYGVKVSSILTAQAKVLAERLNTNLIENGKLWRASKTNVADLTYEEKKAKFGNPVPLFYGFEYYAGGVFDLPGSSQNLQNTSLSSSACVDEWDWRNRHGKNWMTPVKDQGNCGSCWAFSAVGTLEAYINLYYNRLLGYDLSEQELLSDTICGSCKGGNSRLAMYHIREHGIVEEDCFSYVAYELDPTSKCSNPTEQIFIEQYVNINSRTLTEDSLKHLLFRSPIGLSVSSWSHAIVLVGYKTLHVGDTISRTSQLSSPIIVQENSELVGKTAWLIKNSWGTGISWGDGTGYGYVVFDVHTNSTNIYTIRGRIMSTIFDDNDILCEDADGDGYFYWGIGPKPSTCPSWVPDEPDGDDSDYSKGPTDRNGWLKDNNPDNCDTIYITENTIWNERQYLHHHVCVCDGVTLTIKNRVDVYRDVSITIQPNASLIVDGGIINEAIIKPVRPSSVEISHNGQIRIPINKKYSLPLGTKMNISAGKITHN